MKVKRDSGCTIRDAGCAGNWARPEVRVARATGRCFIGRNEPSIHTVSHGFTWFHMVSHGFTWFHITFLKNILCEPHGLSTTNEHESTQMGDLREAEEVPKGIIQRSTLNIQRPGKSGPGW